MNPPKLRPDDDRWKPKYERKKFAKLAKKKGFMTKTQGTTNVDSTSNTGGFKKGPSTANVKAATGGNAKGKRRK